MYMQTDQILRAKDTPAFGMDNGVSVLDLTNEMSDERKKAYGMEPGEKIYQVSSYQGDQVLENLKNNDLIYVLGRYVVITKPFLDAGAPEEKIKEIRDDFDFEYGFNAVRADGGVPGDDTIIGRVKGDETPGVPGTLTKGKGIFSGGIFSEIGIRGAEPISSLAGRSIVIIGLFQILALIPGVSRAGITMTAARFLKFNRVDSGKISFLLSIPALAGASFLGLKDINNESLEINILVIIAVVLSFLFSYMTVKFFLNYINRFSLNIFVIYRLIIALILFIVIYF